MSRRPLEIPPVENGQSSLTVSEPDPPGPQKTNQRRLRDDTVKAK